MRAKALSTSCGAPARARARRRRPPHRTGHGDPVSHACCHRNVHVFRAAIVGVPLHVRHIRVVRAAALAVVVARVDLAHAGRLAKLVSFLVALAILVRMTARPVLRRRILEDFKI